MTATWTGKTLDNRYIVEQPLGSGATATVYEAQDTQLERRVAVKVLHPPGAADAQARAAFQQEAQLAAGLHHPHLAQVYDAGMDDGLPYIIMERLEGQSLGDRALAGKIPSTEVIAILLQVCDALIAAHAAGIIHRDLKLDNIFLSDTFDDPPTPHVKLLDWGIAKVINRHVRQTAEGELVGTPQYLSPEQARGAEVTPLSDVYSLGVVAYQLFLDRLPFEAETSAEVMTMHLRSTPPPPRELWPEIPDQLEELVLGMLAKHPEDRPSVLDVALRLDDVRIELEQRRPGSSEPLSPAPPASPERVSQKRQPGVSLGAIGVAASEASSSRHGGRGWQLVVGALALCATVAMFVISRADDTAAASTRVAPSAIAGEPSRLGPAIAVAAPAAAGGAAGVEPVHEAIAEIVAPPTAANRAALHKSLSPAHLPNRKGLVPPRRPMHIEPDGTIDPYR